MKQAIVPNPHIPCKPGWCLAYVNEAFGVPKKYGSATAAWYGSATKHTGRDFPPGCWVPVWYALAGEPNGHVVLLTPDGSCYSTSDPSTTPHHHPSLSHLEAYYAWYGSPLTYRGWTEDVEDTAVLASGITLQGTTTPLEDDMLTKEEVDWIAARVAEVIQPMHDVTREHIPGAVLSRPVPYKDPITGGDTGQTTTLATLAGFADFQTVATRALLARPAADIAAQLDAAGIAAAVRDELVKLLGGK